MTCSSFFPTLCQGKGEAITLTLLNVILKFVCFNLANLYLLQEPTAEEDEAFNKKFGEFFKQVAGAVSSILLHHLHHQMLHISLVNLLFKFKSREL